jgi:hypothetical protein
MDMEELNKLRLHPECFLDIDENAKLTIARVAKRSWADRNHRLSQVIRFAGSSPNIQTMDQFRSQMCESFEGIVVQEVVTRGELEPSYRMRKHREKGRFMHSIDETDNESVTNDHIAQTDA